MKSLSLIEAAILSQKCQGLTSDMLTSSVVLSADFDWTEQEVFPEDQTVPRLSSGASASTTVGSSVELVDRVIVDDRERSPFHHFSTANQSTPSGDVHSTVNSTMTSVADWYSTQLQSRTGHDFITVCCVQQQTCLLMLKKFVSSLRYTFECIRQGKFEVFCALMWHTRARIELA
jgi:hypothetical protein